MQESEERYRVIFTQARDGIVLVDSETGSIVDCNPEFENQTGRKLEQLRKMRIWEIRPPNIVEEAKKKFLEIRTAGIGNSSELEFQKPDGEIVFIEFLAKRIQIGGKDYLQGLGAADVLDRKDFSAKARPLYKELWAGAVDVAGGNTLANVLSQIKYGGAVAACGLAESIDLPASVAPFILRGVTLYGIDSVMAPLEKRDAAWKRLAQDLDMNLLEDLSFDLDFNDLPSAAEDILAGKIRGRAIVKIPA
ncbi:MAG: PAS domain S-box protein [Proteobacteria bacterium]|nr:PAS domain S-box protein [Pseudomonadota bacterium]